MKDMSSDTAKENASVVDSSVTEWKHDMRDFDDPDSLVYKSNEDGCHFRAEKALHDWMGNSSVNKKGNLYNTRYFIIKSLNHQNIQLSVEKGIWATQVMNEPILEEAFNNSGKVILIFSVNMSGFFQGYAQMMSTVGQRRDSVWSQGSGKNNPWGRSFKVKWLQLNDLPFQKTLHLKNPLNDFKPVKISRDCQELPEDIGEALCELIDGESDGDRIHGRYIFSCKLKLLCFSKVIVLVVMTLYYSGFPRDNLPIKGPFTESPCSGGDGEYNGPSLHTPWAGTPMPYPPFLYPQHASASRFYLAHQGSNGVSFPENFLFSSSLPKGANIKHSHVNRKLNKLQVESDVPSRSDVWGLSQDSPLASTLTDDDFLEMTYEEYLEVHSRSNRLAAGPSWTTKDTSRSKKHKEDDNESNSNSVSDRSCSHKKARHPSEK